MTDRRKNSAVYPSRQANAPCPGVPARELGGTEVIPHTTRVGDCRRQCRPAGCLSSSLESPREGSPNIHEFTRPRPVAATWWSFQLLPAGRANHRRLFSKPSCTPQGVRKADIGLNLSVCIETRACIAALSVRRPRPGDLLGRTRG